MPIKIIELADIGKVKVSRRKGSKALRLSVDHNGNIQLSLPYWVSLNRGLHYLKSNYQWVAEQQAKNQTLLEDGLTIGRIRQLRFLPGNFTTIRTRLTDNEVRVHYPESFDANHPEVQIAARKSATRALRDDSESLFLPRLRHLSRVHSLSYKSASVRNLKTRWGSCSSDGHITLNIYLSQLPDHLVEYVLLHELAHTRHMDHSARFWALLSEFVPDVKTMRKEIKSHRPRLLIG